MLMFFAHAGEDHGTQAQTVSHYLLAEWYVGLPLLLTLLAVIGYVTFRVTKSRAAGAIVVCLGLLIAGVGLYTLSPITSIVALAFGFGLILAQVMVGLRR